jgi:hypothetical protein
MLQADEGAGCRRAEAQSSGGPARRPRRRPARCSTPASGAAAAAAAARCAAAAAAPAAGQDQMQHRLRRTSGGASGRRSFSWSVPPTRRARARRAGRSPRRMLSPPSAAPGTACENCRHTDSGRRSGTLHPPTFAGRSCGLFGGRVAAVSDEVPARRAPRPPTLPRRGKTASGIGACASPAAQLDVVQSPRRRSAVSQLRLCFAAAFRPSGCRPQIRAAMSATNRSHRRARMAEAMRASASRGAARLLGWCCTRRAADSQTQTRRPRHRSGSHAPSWISPPGTRHGAAPEQSSLQAQRAGVCFRRSTQVQRRPEPRKYISQLPPSAPACRGEPQQRRASSAPHAWRTGVSAPADVTACCGGGQPSGVQRADAGDGASRVCSVRRCAECRALLPGGD